MSAAAAAGPVCNHKNCKEGADGKTQHGILCPCSKKRPSEEEQGGQHNRQRTGPSLLSVGARQVAAATAAASSSSSHEDAKLADSDEDVSAAVSLEDCWLIPDEDPTLTLKAFKAEMQKPAGMRDIRSFGVPLSAAHHSKDAVYFWSVTVYDWEKFRDAWVVERLATIVEKDDAQHTSATGADRAAWQFFHDSLFAAGVGGILL